MEVLDLFSAAAGGWSLGMHRAGFRTVAACEWIDWRRALYLQNNPGVRMYDDVRTLTGEQLLRDLGFLPRVVVGSPPCQDISPANTKGKGVEGERSGLYFEAIRIIGEVRPRWFALENSANLRARGADAVLAALEAIGYSCWAFVVRAGDIRANHERPRSWIIGCDLEQIAVAAEIGRPSWSGFARSTERYEPGHLLGDAPQDGRRERGAGRCAEPASRLSIASRRNAAGDASDADQAGQADGCLEPRLRQAQEPDHGRRDVGGDDVADADGEGQSDGTVDAEMGRGEGLGDDVAEPWADWNGGLAGHLRLDDGLSAWVAQSRIAVGGPRGTSAASLIVEAFGDAVVPQIPEAIGRAILRTEAALSAIYAQRIAA